MKLIIFILALIILPISQAQNNDWVDVLAAEVDSSPEIQTLLDFGAQYIAEIAVKDLTVPDTPYQAVQIYKAVKQVNDDEVKFNFSIQLDNFEGTQINATFTVHYQPAENRVRVTSYSYQYIITETACLNEDPSKVDSLFEEEIAEEEAINEEEMEFNMLTGWFEVDMDNIGVDKEIQDLLNFGIKRVAQAAVEDGNAYESDYTVTDVYRVLVQIKSGVKYKFYVKLANDEGDTIKAILVVYYQSWTGRKDVTCYRYSAITKTREGEGNEEEVILEEEQQEPPVVVPVEDEEEEEVTEEETTEENNIPGGWSPVDLSEVESSDVIQGLLNFGADYIKNKAIEDGKVPDTAYDVVQIYSVLRQVVSGLNYKFEVKLDNGEGTTINATYVIWYQAWTDKKSVTSYSYTFLTKELDCDNLDPDMIDYPVENEDLLNEESNEEEAILTEDYAVVDVSEAVDNEEIQHLLNLGVEAVLEAGRKDGKIPDSDFEVSEIYRIWRRAVNGTKYKFHVKLDNGAGVTVNAIFVVYSQAWSEQTKVTCYRYSVSSNNN